MTVLVLPMPGTNFDFPSLRFQVPICGFAARHATVAANDRAVTTAVIRVFICAGDSGRNAVTRQYQFETITPTRVLPFDGRFCSRVVSPGFYSMLGVGR